MKPIPQLSYPEFDNRFSEYLSNFPPSEESITFEGAVESDTYQRLVENWSYGWDFDSKTDFFSGRGTSILIQNTQIDWEEFLEWLHARTVSIPEGALINFEVYDNIMGKVNIGNGPMLLRRVITASGIFDEVD